MTMHYFSFHIGDYKKDTFHLTQSEDLAYRRLLDLYYSTEKPLIDDEKKLSRLIGMHQNADDVAQVLSDFFTLTDRGFIQKRIEKEIARYHERADSARTNGKKGGRPRKPNPNPAITQSVILANPTLTQQEPNPNPAITGSKANHEPLTINQEPLTKDQVLQADIPAPVSQAAPVPIGKIVDLYHEMLCPPLPKIVKLTKTREGLIRQRWLQKDLESLNDWEMYFTDVSRSDFLMGRTAPTNGRNVFSASLEWLCKPGNFAKVAEARYNNERD